MPCLGNTKVFAPEMAFLRFYFLIFISRAPLPSIEQITLKLEIILSSLAYLVRGRIDGKVTEATTGASAWVERNIFLCKKKLKSSSVVCKAACYTRRHRCRVAKSQTSPDSLKTSCMLSKNSSELYALFKSC